MKFKSLVLFLVVGCFLVTNTAYGDTSTDLRISGKIYFEWAYLTGSSIENSSWGPGTDDEYGPNHNDTFRVQRVYLTLRRNITENWLVRVTTDVGRSDNNPLYLKYAYIQYSNGFFGFLDINLCLGKISTPITGIIENLSDYRWLFNNYYDAAKYILSGHDFDNSADYGFSLGFTLADMVHLTFAMTNGEGFKHQGDEIDQANPASDHKIYYAVVSITPMEQLWINGYFNYEDVAADTITASGTSYQTVWGTGIAWKSDFIKIGVNFFMMQYTDKTGTFRDRDHYTLIDSWLNINMGALVESFPVLFAGRFSQGYIAADEDGTYQRTMLVAGGLGWQFNSKFRVMAFYERYIYSAGEDGTGGTDPRDASRFYVKTEIKF